MVRSKSFLLKAPRVLAAALVAVALCAGVLAGCTTGNESAGQKNVDQSASQNASESAVAVTVQNAVSDETLASGSVELPEGATALDALQALPIDVVVEDSQYGPYVSSVEGVASEGMCGWVYTINGEELLVSAGEAEVKPGDTVAWSYIDMSE